MIIFGLDLSARIANRVVVEPLRLVVYAVMDHVEGLARIRHLAPWLKCPPTWSAIDISVSPGASNAYWIAVLAGAPESDCTLDVEFVCRCSLREELGDLPPGQ